jgi:hypothetical protein
MDRVFFMCKIYNHVGPCVLHSCYGSDFIVIILESLIRCKTANISVDAKLDDVKEYSGCKGIGYRSHKN